ncbi:MAG: DUF2283 domain-containing protein [bacterium]|nr:DUF2283 domain-containing protein [bacterium]
MKKISSYDEENDILSIHKGFAADEKFKGNIDVGELVLDVSTKGRIKGIEVMNATSFFKEFDMEKRVLKNIVDAQFTASVKPNSIIIGLVLKAKNVKHEMPAKIAVPLEVPIGH